MAKRERTDVMLAQPFAVRRLDKWPKPWLLQPKINGDRCRAELCADGTVQLYSSTARLIESVPHIVADLTTLSGTVLPLTLDGELYYHGWPHNKIRSIVSRQAKNLHPDHAQLQFYCFDVIEDFPQIDREAIRTNLGLNTKPSLYLVPTVQCTTHAHLLACFDSWVDEGYEGLIVRHPTQTYIPRKTPFMMKMKKFTLDTFPICAYAEEHDIYSNPKGTLGAVTVALPNGKTSDVGTGFTADERTDLWLRRDQLIGRQINVRYQELSPFGRLLMPSFKGFADGGI